jgi:hypothetical protein
MMQISSPNIQTLDFLKIVMLCRCSIETEKDESSLPDTREIELIEAGPFEHPALCQRLWTAETPQGGVGGPHSWRSCGSGIGVGVAPKR